jgi:hypothetical protein
LVEEDNDPTPEKKRKRNSTTTNEGRIPKIPRVDNALDIANPEAVLPIAVIVANPEPGLPDQDVVELVAIAVPANVPAQGEELRAPEIDPIPLNIPMHHVEILMEPQRAPIIRYHQLRSVLRLS